VLIATFNEFTFKESDMSQVKVVKEFSVFGATLGDCVVVASYDSDAWRQYLDDNQESKCPSYSIDSVSLNGVEIDSTCRKLFGRTELDRFEQLVATSWRTESKSILERFELESIADDIFNAIEVALDSYVSLYDSAELV
jgi:hypothetical protein